MKTKSQFYRNTITGDRVDDVVTRKLSPALKNEETHNNILKLQKMSLSFKTWECKETVQMIKKDRQDRNKK